MISLPPTPLTVDTALSLIRQSRPQVEPNSGFIKQLRMYEAMNCPTTQEELESHKIYRRWMNSREVMDALSDNRAPTMEHISFRDEENEDDDETGSAGRLTDAVASLDLSNPDDDSPSEIANPDMTLSSPSPAPSLPADLEIKCRKCRRLLAKSSFVLPHKPPPHRDPSVEEGRGDPCAHIFLHPLSWMRPTLSEGGLDGRLTCPTQWCGANIGKFAWQGLRCSCGGWVTPGFGLAKGKVDEVRVRPALGAAGGSHASSNSSGKHAFASAVRLPPGMRKGGSNGNL
jgi:dual specificity phosphatase 12